MEFTIHAIKACIIFTLQHLLEEWRSHSDPEHMVNVNEKESNYSSTPSVLDGKHFFPHVLNDLELKREMDCSIVHSFRWIIQLLSVISCPIDCLAKHPNFKPSYYLKCINLIQVLNILVSNPHRTLNYWYWDMKLPHYTFPTVWRNIFNIN